MKPLRLGFLFVVMLLAISSSSVWFFSKPADAQQTDFTQQLQRDVCQLTYVVEPATESFRISGADRRTDGIRVEINQGDSHLAIRVNCHSTGSSAEGLYWWVGSALWDIVFHPRPTQIGGGTDSFAIQNIDGDVSDPNSFTPVHTLRSTNIDGTFLVREPTVARDFFTQTVTSNPDFILPSTDSTVPEEDPTCESNPEDMSWLLCGIIRNMDKAVEFLDDALSGDKGLLRVSSEYFNDPAIADAWARIRNIAYIILVPIMLVMVISTALGFEFISAYTVKKALPRFIAATIFIALSLEITKFLVEFTNVLGRGVAGLITQPFGGFDTITLSSIFSPGAGSEAAFVGFGAIAAVAAAATISLGILASYAFVSMLGLFVGFTLLALRQMLIVALMILAPVAILAWIFQGRDRLWKLWFGTFTKLLLLFPLIMALVASGRAFASIAGSIGGQDVSIGPNDLVTTLIKLVAYVGPFFFIPATFKFAGGVFANLAGWANDKERGLFDRQRKYRGEKMGRNWSDWKRGDKAWRPRAFNNLGQRVGSGWKGRYGFGAAGAGAMDVRRRAAGAEATKDPMLQQLGFHDDAIAALALSGGTKQGAIKRLEQMGWEKSRIKEAVSTASQIGFDRTKATAAMDVMAQNKSRALTGEWAGDAGMSLIRDSANEISGGNAALTENLMGSVAFNSRRVGRFDFGGEGVNQSAAQGWTRASIGQHMQGFGASTGFYVKNFANTLRGRTVAYGATHDADGNRVGYTAEEKRAAATGLLEMHGNLTGATDEIRQQVVGTLTASETEGGLGFDLNRSVAEQLAHKASVPSLSDPSQGMSAGELQSTARTWGSGGVPLGAREVPGGPAAEEQA